MNDEHLEVESDIFEFCKMRAFLSYGISIHIDGLPYPPINIAQDYVNALLLVDLISVLDKAAFHFMKYYQLDAGGKAPIDALFEAGYVFNAPYLKWYREWRHDTAHRRVRHDSYKVDQAVRDVTHQFKLWGMRSASYIYHGFQYKTEDGRFRLGTKAQDISILEYEAWENKVEEGRSTSSRPVVNLSLVEFESLKNPK